MSRSACDIPQGAEVFCQILATTYGIYLKTQNYHWNVEGKQFYALHLLFEQQYQQLGIAIDELAEHIRALGHRPPATFEQLQHYCLLKEQQDIPPSCDLIIEQLLQDHRDFLKFLSESIEVLTSHTDAGSIDLLAQRLRAHQKIIWMLKSHL